MRPTCRSTMRKKKRAPAVIQPRPVSLGPCLSVRMPLRGQAYFARSFCRQYDGDRSWARSRSSTRLGSSVVGVTRCRVVGGNSFAVAGPIQIPSGNVEQPPTSGMIHRTHRAISNTEVRLVAIVAFPPSAASHTPCEPARGRTPHAVPSRPPDTSDIEPWYQYREIGLRLRPPFPACYFHSQRYRGFSRTRPYISIDRSPLSGRSTHARHPFKPPPPTRR